MNPFAATEGIVLIINDNINSYRCWNLPISFRCQDMSVWRYYLSTDFLICPSANPAG